jgi:hypothetical protein
MVVNEQSEAETCAIALFSTLCDSDSKRRENTPVRYRETSAALKLDLLSSSSCIMTRTAASSSGVIVEAMTPRGK